MRNHRGAVQFLVLILVLAIVAAAVWALLTMTPHARPASTLDRFVYYDCSDEGCLSIDLTDAALVVVVDGSTLPFAMRYELTPDPDDIAETLSFLNDRNVWTWGSEPEAAAVPFIRIHIEGDRTHMLTRDARSDNGGIFDSKADRLWKFVEARFLNRITDRSLSGERLDDWRFSDVESLLFPPGGAFARSNVYEPQEQSSSGSPNIPRFRRGRR